jgi:hypothetical protein
MWFRRYRSPHVFIVLVCVCTLIGLYQFQHNLWRDYATQNRSTEERFVDKYESLRPLLPKEETTCFLIDESHTDSKLCHPDGRLFLAQYAMSPQLVTRCAGSRWIIIDSDCPEIVPDIATSAQWHLVADLRNGVRLYRTNVRE